MWSALRLSRKILPDGDWIANLAGFSRPEFDRVDDMADVEAENSFETVDTDEPPAELETILRALAGRARIDGEMRPLRADSLPLDGTGMEAGCWRTAKTNVLLTASLEH